MSNSIVALVDAKEVQAALKIKGSSLLKLQRKGLLSPIKVAGKRLYSVESINNLIARLEAEAKAQVSSVN